MIRPKDAGRLTNNVDSDKTAPLGVAVQSDLGLHCLFNRICSNFNLFVIEFASLYYFVFALALPFVDKFTYNFSQMMKYSDNSDTFAF